MNRTRQVICVIVTLAFSCSILFSCKPILKVSKNDFNFNFLETLSSDSTTLSIAAIANDPAFLSAKKALLNASQDGNEHYLSFAHQGGKIITSAINAGSAYVASAKSEFQHPIADLHNHKTDLPPSSGDLYGFIEKTNSNAAFIRYVLMSSGSLYAMVLEDKNAAASFVKNTPK